MQVVNKAFYDSLVATLPESAKLADERMRRFAKERQRVIDETCATILDEILRDSTGER